MSDTPDQVYRLSSEMRLIAEGWVGGQDTIDHISKTVEFFFK